MVARFVCDGDATSGNPIATTREHGEPMLPSRCGPRAAHASAAGSGRPTPAVDHDDSPGRLGLRRGPSLDEQRDDDDRRGSTSVVAACRSTFHRTSWSITPSADARAERAWAASSCPHATRGGQRGQQDRRAGGDVECVSPSDGARRTTVSAANAPTTVHSISDRRCTGMPSSRARSTFSAMPRSAMPASVRSRNHDNARATIGTTASSNRSLPVTITGSIATRDVRQRRLERADERRAAPVRSGRNSAIPPSTWASPIVATVRTSRGAVEEPPDHQPLDDRAGRAAPVMTADRDAHRPRPPLAEEQPDGEAAADAAHRAVGEVHDAGRAIREHEPDGEQARRRAEHRAEDDDTERHSVRRTRASTSSKRRDRAGR